RILPDQELLAPVVRTAFGGGNPHLQADGAGIAPGRFHIAAQLVEFRVGDRARRMRKHDPAIAPLGDAPQCCVLVTAEPERYSTPRRQWIDARILDRVPLSLEGDARLGPQF